MLRLVGTNKIRFTKKSLQQTRKNAAAGGFAVNQVRSISEGMEATIKALPSYLVEDMLNFFETGKSRFTSAASAQELQALIAEAQSEDPAP